MSSEADRLLREANSLVASASKSGGFFSFSSSSKDEKYEQAVTKYKDAGAEYKKAGELAKSANAYISAGKLFQKEEIKSIVSAMQCYKQAAQLYLETDLQKAISCLEIGLAYAEGEGRDDAKAADLLSHASLGIAILQERLAIQSTTPEERKRWLQQAAANWDKAANLYKGLPYSEATLKRVRDNQGRVQALCGNYLKAFEAFKANADTYQAVSVAQRHSVATYLVNAGLCLLAEGDTVRRDQEFQAWGLLVNEGLNAPTDPLKEDLVDQREGKFLLAVRKAEQSEKKDEIDIAVKQIWLMNMDPWQKACLEKVKERINDEDDFS